MKTKNLLGLILIGFVASILSRSAFAQQDGLVDSVGSEMGNHGYRQIFYLDSNGNKNFITDYQFTSANPQREGDYVTYMSQIEGAWQIFLYHIPSSTRTQLTVSGNNVNPQIENGLVVWEGWINGNWQVFLYDSTGVRQLTYGDLSINPEIEGGRIVMARRGVSGTWRSVLYTINDKSFADISTGTITKHPHLENQKIYHGEEEFPLFAEDISLLDFDAIFSPTTEEEILKEVFGETATGSAVLQESTPSASPSTSEDN